LSIPESCRLPGRYRKPHLPAERATDPWSS
jgi:hypothetical protein